MNESGVTILLCKLFTIFLNDTQGFLRRLRVIEQVNDTAEVVQLLILLSEGLTEFGKYGTELLLPLLGI